jgi:hypothetical protein
MKYSSELRMHEHENIENIEKELNSLEALCESMDNTDLNRNACTKSGSLRFAQFSGC